MKHIKTFEDFVNESVNEGRGPETVKEPKAKDIEVKDKYKKGEGIFYRVTFGASPMVANSKSETSKSVYYARIDKVSKDGRGNPLYVIGWDKVPHNMVIGAKVNESVNESTSFNVEVNADEPYDINKEKSAASKFKFNSTPVTIDSVLGDIGDSRTELFIKSSNGDLIRYEFIDGKKWLLTIKSYDRDYIAHVKTDVIQDYLGSTGTIVGDILLLYNDFLDGNMSSNQDYDIK